MMWDIPGAENQNGHASSVMQMPSPAMGSASIIVPAPSHHSGYPVPTAGVPSAHSYGGYAGSSSEYDGAPLVRAISASPHPSHHRHRHNSNPPQPDMDRALLPSFIVKSSHHHHKHHKHHKHSHSADRSPHHHSHGTDHRPHHHSHEPKPSSGGHHHHSQSHALPAPTHHYQQQQLQQYPAPRPRIEHPPFHPQFLYSMCTGRKKALCIGVNYIGEPHELHGCINDAKAMRQFLIRRHGYKSEDIVLLTDDSPNPRSRPTRRNMIEGMQWLIQSARCHDSLFFHYSGHGGQTKDLDGDEVDGLDEVIFPMDFQAKGHILDDDLFKIMVRPLPAGCRLTALFDSCHSGTVLDLPFIYAPSGRLRGQQVSDRAIARRSSPADVISFSACKDGQKSTDTFKGGVAVGAMSWAYCEVMTKNPNQSYQQIMKEVNNLTYPRYHQTPQLGSSHHIDLNRRFII